MTPRGRSPPYRRYEMRIADSREDSYTTWTKCAKMTEEGHTIHGMNGGTDGSALATKEEFPRAAYTQGGRLKFFKDGKFILELERAREGERVSWVSVPRKTYWPPQGNASTLASFRQDGGASLSVSDDNSSIQSSPWQRDHSWKQTSPRHNLSREMTFYYYSQVKNKLKKKSNKRRRPYASSPNPVNSFSANVNSEPNTNFVCNKVKKEVCAQPSLLTIIQKLLDKLSSSTPPRLEVVVSPRKRFLREMENKLQFDDACQKRSRSKTQTVTVACATPPSNIKVESPVRLNGMSEEGRAPRNSSYSITSLLAEDRISRRSPSESPSRFTPVTQNQYCSPSEDPWYSESVDRLRSIELSQVDKRVLSAYSPYPYVSPYMYQYSLPPYYSPGMYGRNYIVPPVYTTAPMPVAIRHDTPSCSWTADTPKNIEPRDDNITDMPLNLSKHAG